jgi:hypothetical protein
MEIGWGGRYMLLRPRPHLLSTAGFWTDLKRRRERFFLCLCYSLHVNQLKNVFLDTLDWLKALLLNILCMGESKGDDPFPEEEIKTKDSRPRHSWT